MDDDDEDAEGIKMVAARPGGSFHSAGEEMASKQGISQ